MRLWATIARASQSPHPQERGLLEEDTVSQLRQWQDHVSPQAWASELAAPPSWCPPPPGSQLLHPCLSLRPESSQQGHLCSGVRLSLSCCWEQSRGQWPTSPVESGIGEHPFIVPTVYNAADLLPCSETRHGAPSLLWPPFLSSQPGGGLPAPLLVTPPLKADSPLNGVAGDGAAPSVTGRGPGQNEAVSVHIQAQHIQWGAWGPGLLCCSI